MKNILIIIDSLGVGGAEKVVLTLADGFKRRNNVEIISVDGIVQFDISQDIRVHTLDFHKKLFDYTFYKYKLSNLIRKIEDNNAKKFDLVLVHLQKATRLSKHLKYTNSYHVVHSTFSQSAFKNRKGLSLYFKRKKLQKIYNGLNIITVSDGIKDDLLKKIRIKPKTIKTIYNPVDKETIQKKAQEENIIKEKEYIVHVGRLAQVKRHDILIKAYKEANIKEKLVIVGDGEEKENIVKLVEELNLKDKVILTGFMQNPYPIIKGAKLLVLSSEYEGLPTVLVEALMLNTCVVSSDCDSGPREILTGEYSKYLAKVNDIKDLSNKIKEATSHLYKIEKKLYEKFELDFVVEKYMDLI